MPFLTSGEVILNLGLKASNQMVKIHAVCVYVCVCVCDDPTSASSSLPEPQSVASLPAKGSARPSFSSHSSLRPPRQNPHALLKALAVSRVARRACHASLPCSSPARWDGDGAATAWGEEEVDEDKDEASNWGWGGAGEPSVIAVVAVVTVDCGPASVAAR